MCKNVTSKLFIYKSHNTYKQDLVLNNLQGLICNQNPTNQSTQPYFIYAVLSLNSTWFFPITVFHKASIRKQNKNPWILTIIHLKVLDKRLYNRYLLDMKYLKKNLDIWNDYVIKGYENFIKEADSEYWGDNL